jgi:hypothetical protein
MPFRFSSYLGVFLGDIADWWVKDSADTVLHSQIQLYFNGTCMREDSR